MSLDAAVIVHTLSVNGSLTEQSIFDFRTGRETAFQGAFFGPGERSACSALNRRRAKGITEATRDSPSRQSYAPHAWAALVDARSRQWGVPLIDLAALGIGHECAWIMSDLHQGNIMRDAQGQPTIIDALLAPLPPALIKGSRLLAEHVEDAMTLRHGLPLAGRKAFDDVKDEDL